MSPGKHDAALLSTYIRTHENYLEQFIRRGFVLRAGLPEFELIDDHLLLEGTIQCVGGIGIAVSKRIDRITTTDDPLVKTSSYRYHVQLGGVGPIVRYDSPHETHNRAHHVHHYDIFAGDREGRVQFFYGEDWPTLGEVIETAEQWYYENQTALAERGLIPAGGA